MADSSLFRKSRPFDRGKRWLLALANLPQRVRAARVARGARAQAPDSGVVVLVATRSVQVRACKLALAIRLTGRRVVLLHRDEALDGFDPELRRLFDETVTYASPEDAVVKAAAHRPIAYHVLCNWDYSVASAFVRWRPGVVVVDTKDVLAAFVRPHVMKEYPFEEEAERFCLENADGICCSDLRTQYLKRSRGYRLAPRLLWPDYCWPAGFAKRRPRMTEGRHVAYAGSIEVDPSSQVAYLYPLALLLAKAGRTLHVYPSHHEQVIRLREQMAKTLPPDLSKHAVIHETVSPLSLIEELSQFHAGIIVSNTRVNFGLDDDTYYPIMGEYFLASKLFDYHEAGLLCLTQRMPVAWRVFPNNGAFREVGSLEDIVKITSESALPHIEVEPKRRLDYHAGRLFGFYVRLDRDRRNRRSGRA